MSKVSTWVDGTAANVISLLLAPLADKHGLPTNLRCTGRRVAKAATARAADAMAATPAVKVAAPAKGLLSDSEYESESSKLTTGLDDLPDNCTNLDRANGADRNEQDVASDASSSQELEAKRNNAVFPN